MSSPEQERIWRLGVLACANAGSLEGLVAPYEGVAPWRWVRPPEIGLVMTRGRAGATGAAFNLGETTATRCALRLETGEMGVACVLGRNKAQAKHVALVDALMQTDFAGAVSRDVLAPLAAEAETRRTAAARRAAATRVEFFTMARGE